MSGVTQPVALAVSYGQNGTASPTPTAVDTVVGLALNGKASSSSLITSVAKSLLAGNGQSS